MDNFTQRPTADNTIVVTSLEFLNNKKRFVHFIPEIYGPSFYTWYQDGSAKRNPLVPIFARKWTVLSLTRLRF